MYLVPVAVVVTWFNLAPDFVDDVVDVQVVHLNAGEATENKKLKGKE